MMRAVHGSGESYEEYEYLYGKRLLEEKDPCLGRIFCGSKESEKVS